MKITAKAVVLSEGYTATTDYYLIPQLEKSGYEVFLIDYRASVPDISYFLPYQLLVISRYISYQWLVLLKKLHQSNIKIIYFMDDDLFDFHAIKILALGHQWKIVSKAFLFRTQLMQLCNEFWVSTPYLVEKYAKFQPVLVNPRICHATMQRKKAVYVCYHGSPSHWQEITWLIPIIEQVQTRSNQIHFELFATGWMKNKLKHLPRVSLLHSMSWSNYLAFTATQQRDIALAPLLECPFNAARAEVKFYDYARLQAVGLYSDVAPYQGFIRDGQDGFLLANNPVLWVEKLLQLADDISQRQTMLIQINQRTSEILKNSGVIN
jgi:hypothetical protein